MKLSINNEYKHSKMKGNIAAAAAADDDDDDEMH